MNIKLKAGLIEIAQKRYFSDDPSHDFQHIFRVLNVAEQIARDENADLDIVIPSALFHDIVSYSKKDPRNKNASVESAQETRKILESIPEYPQEKIALVESAITTCSFSKGLTPEHKEGDILQDADGLEATGALSIMRTFSTSGIMKRAFYDPADPFAKNRGLDDLKYALDLFSTRLLKVIDRMHTKTAKNIAARRTEFLKRFLEELAQELKETGYKV